MTKVIINIKSLPLQGVIRDEDLRDGSEDDNNDDDMQHQPEIQPVRPAPNFGEEEEDA